MHTTQPIPRPTWRDLIGMLTFYLAVTAVAVWTGRRDTPEAARLSVATIAFGTLAMGGLVARRTAYPRWGVWGASVVLAAGALLNPVMLADPIVWAEGARPMLWMYPWTIMVLATIPSRSKTGVCAPDRPWSGWLLIGSAAVLTLITYGSVVLGRRA